jgi:hypothetical protein
LALKLTGLKLHDLVFLPESEYFKKYPSIHNDIPEILENRYTHFEQRRQDLLNLAKSKRDELSKKSKNTLSAIS